MKATYDFLKMKLRNAFEKASEDLYVYARIIQELDSSTAWENIEKKSFEVFEEDFGFFKVKAWVDAHGKHKILITPIEELGLDFDFSRPSSDHTFVEYWHRFKDDLAKKMVQVSTKIERLKKEFENLNEISR